MTQTEQASKFITIIRPEFMTFCQDACRAAALNHLLFRIAYKSKDQPKENIQAGQILWYAKTALITGEMSNAWGVCKVRNEVNGLVDMNLIGRCNNPAWGADRTKHFFFGAEQCKVLVDLCEKNGICLVHLGLPAEVVHLIYSANANDKSIKCSCPDGEANDKSIKCIRSNHHLQMMIPSNAFDKNIEAITKNTTKNYNKDNTEEERGANPQNSQASDVSGSAIAAPAHSLSANFVNYFVSPTSESQGVSHGSKNNSTANIPTPDNSRVADENIQSQPARHAQGLHLPAETVSAEEVASSYSPDLSTTPAQQAEPVAQPVVATAASKTGYTKEVSGKQKVSSMAKPVVPEKPAKSARTRTASARVNGNEQNKTYWSLEGAMFRSWYEAATGMRMNDTAANARACHKLAGMVGVSEESVKQVVADIRADEWVKTKKVKITVQDLADDASKQRWEKWYLEPQQPAPAPAPSGPKKVRRMNHKTQVLEWVELPPEPSYAELEEMLYGSMGIRPEAMAHV
jgi:hypothetical protein